MKRSERCCGNCVYFQTDGFVKVCRRRPPSMGTAPGVEPDWWCGEHATEEEYDRSKRVIRCKQLEQPDGSLRQPKPGEALEVTFE